MPADDRSASASALSSGTNRASTTGSATQTASFAIGALRVELIAAPGTARLVFSTGDDREVYVVEPAALASWASATARLLSLTPAGEAGDGAQYRAPFLIDREGRPAVAFEGLVSAQAVAFRMLVTGAESRVAGIMTTADIIRDITNAAGGAVAVARAATL